MHTHVRILSLLLGCRLAALPSTHSCAQACTTRRPAAQQGRVRLCRPLVTMPGTRKLDFACPPPSASPFPPAFTAAYLGSILTTLYAALFMHSYVLSLVCSGLQVGGGCAAGNLTILAAASGPLQCRNNRLSDASHQSRRARCNAVLHAHFIQFNTATARTTTQPPPPHSPPHATGGRALVLLALILPRRHPGRALHAEHAQLGGVELFKQRAGHGAEIAPGVWVVVWGGRVILKRVLCRLDKCSCSAQFA